MVIRSAVVTWCSLAVLAAQEPPPPAPEIEIEDSVADSLILLQGPLALGAPPPAVEWGPWRRGEPVVPTGDKAPACSVFLFYSPPRAVAEATAANDVEYVADLQRRFAAKGLRIAVAIGDPDTTLGDAWANCSVVVDTENRVAATWGAAFDQNVAVFDRAGNTVFQGSLGSGLVDAIAEAVAGPVDPKTPLLRAWMRDMLRQGIDNFDSPVPVKDVLAVAGHDGFLWASACLLAATKAHDGAAAQSIRKDAIERLAGESRPLAVFADLALRGDPDRTQFAGEFVASLQAASAASPQDPFVQLALLRALVLADRSRDVGRQAARTAKLVRTSAEHSAAFAEILLHATVPAVHADLVRQATQQAESLGGAPRAVAALKYTTALRCDEDPAAAKAALAAYLGETELRVQLNNDCWYLMTQTETAGRFPWFAVALAERMLEQRENMEYFEFDTVALAMAGVGRWADAVEMQDTAIKKGGHGQTEYDDRLRRYQQRVAPPKPR